MSKLGFLRRARGLGFSIEECRSLLSLYEDRSRASKDVKEIALAKLADIERKIQELRSLHGALSHLAEACHGDERPDCPILEDLAGSPEDDGNGPRNESAGVVTPETPRQA